MLIFHINPGPKVWKMANDFSLTKYKINTRAPFLVVLFHWSAEVTVNYNGAIC